MKIKVTKRPYKQVIEDAQSKKGAHSKPKKASFFFRTLMKVISLPDMMATHFTCKKIGMEKLEKGEPAFILMNHSSFIDLEIVATALYPRPFNIVATTDAFFGKEWLLRNIGCIPTKKFCSDTVLVRDMLHAARKLKNHVVMFPEAGYTLDGTTTTLSDSIGKCVKMLGIPLVMLKTYGAFARDPLYNNLQKRKVKVSATLEYLLSKEQIAEMPAEEITKIVFEQFSFDGFKWQKENNIKIAEKFRADGLERLLYKCPVCKTEGKMLGKGTRLKCQECGREYELSEYGELIGIGKESEFPHIPDWYKWERAEVRREIEEGSYLLDTPVDMWISTGTDGVFDIGDGHLVHNASGFHLTGANGDIDYEHKPLTSHSICADFNFYERGDIIALSAPECIYYCFPKDQTIPVAKARLAAEEIYKIAWQEHENSKLTAKK